MIFMSCTWLICQNQYVYKNLIMISESLIKNTLVSTGLICQKQCVYKNLIMISESLIKNTLVSTGFI